MAVCPKCGHSNPTRANYCANCAAPLAEENVRGRQLPAQTITVGSAPDNDVVIDMPMVSSHHLRLTRQPDQTEQWRVVDLNSTNGTTLEGSEERIQETVVNKQQSLVLGSYQVTVKRLLRAVDPFLVHGYRYQKVGGRQWYLNSETAQKAGIKAGGLAPNHATFTQTETGWHLQAAAPIQHLREGWVKEGATKPLKVGTWLALGDLIVILDQQGFWWIDTPRPWFLHCDKAEVTVSAGSQRKKILNDARFLFYPGEFCALMGIAGAGKSTLMKAMTGQMPLSAGDVYLDNATLSENPDLFRRDFGFVPQEEIYHKDLTVRQVLTFAAELRITDETLRSNLASLVVETFERVGLGRFEGLLDTRVARLSGGQKRRLSLAIELLTKPNVLFLDEPTSGLSSEDARLVIGLLRQLANQGMIILVTIHQPSLELYQQFDRVVYLHEGGTTVYDGPASPDSMLYADPKLTPREAIRPELVLETLDRQNRHEAKKRYQQSAYRREYLEQREEKHRQQAMPDLHAKKPAVSLPKQWWTLLRRTLCAKFQDRMQAIILLGQAPIVALLISLVFAPERPGLIFERVATVHFLTVFAALFFGCSNCARDVCGEWTIFKRERMFDMNPVAYLGAKLCVGFLIGLIQCFILLFIVKIWTEFNAPFRELLPQLTLASFAGATLGLFISTVASPFKKNNEVAVGLVPIVMLPLVILGGFVQPYKDLPQTTQLLADQLPARWYLEAALISEEQHTEGSATLESDIGEYAVHRKDYVRKPYFNNRENDAFLMGPIILFCLALSLFALILLFR